MIKQGSVWMVKLGTDNIIGHEQKGDRPFYVISSTEYNSASNTPVGFFLSTSEHKRSNKYTVAVMINGTAEYVNVSQIRTISSDRLLRHMGDSPNSLSGILEVFNSSIL
jgi:mRNA-degrading endonuclease toxin of MazEF toxin-antitoxin module